MLLHARVLLLSVTSSRHLQVQEHLYFVPKARKNGPVLGLARECWRGRNLRASVRERAGGYGKNHNSKIYGGSWPALTSFYSLRVLGHIFLNVCVVVL